MANGMIVAPQPEAVEAGARALIAGGNAVDAAIACALMQTVVDPCMAGIAGVGCIQLYLPAEGVHSFIDFYGRAPDAAHPTCGKIGSTSRPKAALVLSSATASMT
jgi:gamma-glutamyltranspeptidase/glutathione hydrolase